MSLRCRIGIHKRRDYRVAYRYTNFFGGPGVTYRWTCARCGKTGTTV